MFSAMAGTLFFTACDGDEDDVLIDGPSVSYTTTPASSNDEVTITTQDELELSIEATTPAGFNVIRVESEDPVVSFERNRNDLGLDAGAESAAVDLTLTFENPGEVILTISAVDDNGNEAIETLTVTIEDARATIYTAKLLYAQTAEEDSKTFFSTNLGTTVSKNEVDASAEPSSIDIDFGYAAGASGVLWLASPSSYPAFTDYDLSIWNTLNTTTFKDVTLNNEEYIATNTSSKLAAVYDAGTNPQDRKNTLEVGKIYAFQLDEDKGSKLGLVKVIEIVDANDDGDFIDNVDYIEIEVTVEQ